MNDAPLACAFALNRGEYCTDPHNHNHPHRAGLGVGHIWTAVSCPAYRTLDGADCTCNNGEG